MTRALLLALSLCLAPLWALAQNATLIADTISFGGEDVVIAEGNVEILYGDQRIQADRIVFDQAADELRIEGPLTIIDETSGAVLTGQDAVLTQDMRRGIIRGARFLLADRLQIAAAELNRVDGRYNQLYKAVASSCNVCSETSTPLWRIRAKRIAHDQETRQLYFDNAWFEVAGVPVVYFPRLRMPDPTLRRATGFLIPELRNSTTLGVGLKFPYFIAINDQSDLRLRPYISSRTRTLEARYRREFSFGSLIVEGAVSSDNLTDDPLRTYLFAEGRFRLPRDFALNVDLRLVSDPSYLIAYGYSDVDRLPSKIELTRTRRDEHISLSVEKLRSLRDVEIPIEDTLATLLGRATYERRYFPAMVGGEARLTFDLEGHQRAASGIDPALSAACTAAGLDLVDDCLSRDVLRAGVEANWRKGWTFGPGIQGAVEGQVAADYYWISQDNQFDDLLGHVTPTAAAEFRWPLARTTAGGAREVLEPVIQIAWTDTLGANVPNEDSQLVEFDEGNLLALSRFPGSDVYERGWRATMGLNWNRLGANNNSYSATIGRVFRLDDLGQFSTASGLDGAVSDWLVAGQVKVQRLTLTNRSLFDDSFGFSKSETQLAYHGESVSAGASYIWVQNDPDEGRTGDTSELKFNADYRFARNWTANLNGRYDGNTNQATEAGFGLGYANECVNIDFSVSRRFTTSTNLTASTEFGLDVSLSGFGQGGSGQARACHHKQG
ncbi:Outer membrane protein Imp [Candidatus Rhodobacter oscarellae]|uniref:LPS-assembly protein LptD n=1 Tax=Candidatus Rhodobacter oscarellae TaxID=1675527 RepID=A0A0J9E0Q0_9RHOB|nr:LPS assembly protein LptD [Candidatus Rhodobacter lobularis]KMW56232.1 Outer membrane protein Imp [Candidatus Rhodobacter lobularis]